MKKIIITVILIGCLFVLSSCKLKTLENTTFVFESFTINEGKPSDDIVPEKVKELEKIYKNIVFHFNKTTLTYTTEYGGETRDYEYKYTYVDGVLNVESNANERFSIKGKKLYLNGTIDGFKSQLIYKLDD